MSLSGEKLINNLTNKNECLFLAFRLSTVPTLLLITYVLHYCQDHKVRSFDVTRSVATENRDADA